MHKTACLLATMILACAAPRAFAQPSDDLDEGVVIEEPFLAGIEPWTWELGLQVGYVDLNKTLLAVPSIVVDVENPADAIFADMELGGEWSFMPQVRVNYNLGRHWSFMNGVGFSIGDFLQSVSEDQEKWRNPDSVNTLTEEEIEKGSYFIFNHEHGLAFYPRGWWILDHITSAEGAVQPFLSVLAGTQSIYLDSDYVTDRTSTFQLSYGGGLRIVGDDLYSISIEARYYHSKVQYGVDSYFREVIGLDGQSRVKFPVGQLHRTADLVAQYGQDFVDKIVEQLGLDGTEDKLPVAPDSYEKRNFNNLWISVGFVAAF
jgi:hypothetical protein